MTRTAEHPIKRMLRENRRRLRQTTVVSQRQLAERLDLDYGQLSNYLAGRRPMPAHLIEQAAQVLGCEPSELMSTEEPVAA